MEGDLAVEEHSLMLLREQLSAVQHIRRELERKDGQISSLKVQLAEAQSFREQAIALRTQCRILEEKVSLLEVSKQEALSHEEARSRGLEERVAVLEEERELAGRREEAMRRRSEEQDVEKQQVEVEAELANRRLEDVRRANDSLQAVVSGLESERAEAKEEARALHDLVDSLRRDLRSREMEVEDLRPLKPRLEESEARASQLKQELDKATTDLKWIPFLESQVSELDRLRSQSIDLEKRGVLDRAALEAEQLRVAALNSEVEGLRQMIARQEKTIEEREREVSRLRAMEVDFSHGKRRWDELRSDNNQLATDLARLRREHRHVLTHVEGLLGALSRSSRDAVRDASLRILTALFSDSNGHRKKEKKVAQASEGSHGPATAAEEEEEEEEERVLWGRMRGVVEEVSRILTDYWDVTDKHRQAEARVEEVEAHNLTLLARTAGLQDELAHTATQLKESRESAEALGAVVKDMKATLQALQRATEELQSELMERDRFLSNMHAQLSLPRASSSDRKPPQPSSRASMLLTDDDSSTASSPRPPPPPRQPQLDFQSLQASVSSYVTDLISKVSSLEQQRHEMLQEMRRKDDEMQEERVLNEERVREMEREHEERLSAVTSTCKKVEDHMLHAKAQDDARNAEALERLEVELRRERRAAEDTRQERDDLATTLGIAQRDLASLSDRYDRSLSSVSVLARVALSATHRTATLCAHKALLLTESLLFHRLHSDATTLALAVSGHYHRQPPATSFRSAVLAVLFAHRLSLFRPRLAPPAPALYLSGVMEPDLPTRHELEAAATQEKAFSLIVSRLVRPPPPEQLMASDGAGRRRPTLLQALALGCKAQAARRRERQWGQEDGQGQQQDGPMPIAEGMQAGRGWQHQQLLGMWDPSGRVVLQMIRRAFLSTTRRLSVMGQELEDARGQWQLSEGEVEETRRQLGHREQEVRDTEALVQALESRLQACEADRRAMVPRQETERMADALQAAQDSVRVLQEELEKARGDIQALSFKLQAADTSLSEQARLVMKERAAQKELEDEALQWRRFALRYQQENAELQDKSLRGCMPPAPPSSSATKGRALQWRTRSPMRAMDLDLSLNKENASSSLSGSGGHHGDMQLPRAVAGVGESQQQRYELTRSIEDMEGLVTRLAKAEEALEGKTTHADELLDRVRRLLADRREQEETLDRLKRGAEHSFASHERARIEAEVRSNEVVRELEDVRRQLKEAETARGQESQARSQRRDLLKQQQEAQSELEDALSSLQQSDGTAARAGGGGTPGRR